MLTLFGWLHCWRAQRVVAKIQREAEARRRKEEREQLLCSKIAREHLDYHLENFARREGRSKIAIERELLQDAIVRRILQYSREDAEARRKSGHLC